MIGAGAWVMGSIASHMVLDTTKWKQGVGDVKDDQKGLDSWADKHGAKLKKVGTAFTVAGALITGFFTKMVLEASEAEEVTSKFYAVFKEEAPGAIAWVDDFSSAVGRSKADVMGWMATLQDTFVPLGFAREEATLFSESLTKLAVDLGSFNDIADADVIRDLQSAMVGNHETMRKYGVIISQNNITQELMNMGIDGGAKSATEAEKAQARYNIIVAGTGDAQGDAIRTAESLANQMKALKGGLSDVAVEIGQELMPVAKSLVGFLKDLVKGFLDWKKENPALASGLIKVGAGLGAIMLVVGPLLIVLPQIVTSVGLLKVAMVSVTTAGPAMLASLVASTAGLLALAVTAYKVYDAVNNLINANKDLSDSEMVADQTAHKHRMNLVELTREAGMTSTQMKDLTEKYKGNTLAMVRAIGKGEEGVELQQALVRHRDKHSKALEKEKKKIDASTDASDASQKVLDDWAKQLKDFNIPSAKDYTKQIETLTTKKGVLKEALDANQISLITYKEEVKNVDDELFKLTGDTSLLHESTKTWIDYLKDQGLMTVKEKKDRVEELEGFVKELDQAYKDGKISLKEWTDATTSAKREIKNLSTVLTTTAIPAVRDMTGVWEQAVDDMPKEYEEKFTKPIITQTVQLSEDWETITKGMGMIFGNLVFDLLMEGDKFVMDWKGLLDQVKSIFAGIVADMAQQWVTDFIGKLVSSSAEGASSIVSTLANAVAPGASSVTEGIGSLAGGISSLANPVNMISGAVTAIASVITALQGPGGPSSTDSWHFEQTWIQQKQLTDYTMINIGGSSGWLPRIHDKINNLLVTTQGIREQQREKHLKELTSISGDAESALGYLKGIEHNTGQIVSKLKTGQKGLHTPAGEVSLAVLHGPETTLPDADLKALMNNGGGGGGSRRVEINVDQDVNLNGQMITTRDFTRKELLPEIIDALKGAFSKTELKEALGLG